MGASVPHRNPLTATHIGAEHGDVRGCTHPFVARRRPHDNTSRIGIVDEHN